MDVVIVVVWQVENFWKPPLVGVCVWVPCWYVPLRGSRLGFYTLPLTRLARPRPRGRLYLVVGVMGVDLDWTCEWRCDAMMGALLLLRAQWTLYWYA